MESRAIKYHKYSLDTTHVSCNRLFGESQTSCLFTKRGLGFENGATVKQIQVVRAGLEPGASVLQVRCPNHWATPSSLTSLARQSSDSLSLSIKDGAYFCYCAYVLRISRYSGFLWVVPTNTGIFLRGLKLCGESRTEQVLGVSKKKFWGNHAFFRDKASIWKKNDNDNDTLRHTLLCILLFFRIIVA